MNKTNLSRQMCHALRHKPEMYGIELDDNDSCLISKLTKGLFDKNHMVTEAEFDRIFEDIVDIAKEDTERYEIDSLSIRAKYGHSFKTKHKREPIVPPTLLFHGTIEKFIPSIVEEGLKPMNRDKVHLTSSYEMAIQKGSRRKTDSKLYIIFIDTIRATLEGNVKFYKESDQVFLSDPIPPQYLKFYVVDCDIFDFDTQGLFAFDTACRAYGSKVTIK